MNAPTLMLPSRVLDAAADVLETNGWIGDAFYEWVKNRDPRNCRVCADAAISVAVGRHPDFGALPLANATGPLVHDPDSEEWRLGGPDAEAHEVIEAARAVFARHLRRVRGYESGLTNGDVIASWNDEPGRTAEEVIRELRAAAAAAREAGR